MPSFPTITHPAGNVNMWLIKVSVTKTWIYIIGLADDAKLHLLFQISELSHIVPPVMLMPDDFKAFSKIKIENHFYKK